MSRVISLILPHHEVMPLLWGADGIDKICEVCYTNKNTVAMLEHHNGGCGMIDRPHGCGRIDHKKTHYDYYTAFSPVCQGGK